jgi:alkaline phosphatase
MILNLDAKIQHASQMHVDWAHFVYKFLSLTLLKARLNQLFLRMRSVLGVLLAMGIFLPLQGQEIKEETLRGSGQELKPEIKKPQVQVPASPRKVKNVILMIGDGTGLAQWSAAQSRIKDSLHVYRLSEHLGLSNTSSSSHFITDSGAGATAISIGEKTYNKAIGVKSDSSIAFTLSEILHVKGKSTGIVASCGLTHATPASFYAHQINRSMDKEIAQDFYSGFIDVAIGGGFPFFDTGILHQMGYGTFFYKECLFDSIRSPRFVGFYDTSNNVPKYSEGRGRFLKDATMAAIENLSSNENGFFLMVEGSQIDWGGHDNDVEYVISETLDFDSTIAAVGDWAKNQGETLVIVTADHETGGLSLNDETKNKEALFSFSTKHHTGIPVPVFAFGPRASLFRGYYENHQIYYKILEALQIKP